MSKLLAYAEAHPYVTAIAILALILVILIVMGVFAGLKFMFRDEPDELAEAAYDAAFARED